MDVRFSELFESIQRIANGFIERIPHLILAVLVFFICFFAGKLFRRVGRGIAEKRSRHRNLGIVLGRLLQALIILIGFLVAMVIAVPSFKPGQVVELLGIGSVAIGFAFRDILQNFLAGILLLLQEPFKIKDQIIYKEFEGTIEDIQIRATNIRTYDGRRVVIPNSELYTNAVTVNTAYGTRRVQYDFGIGYGDDVDLAKRLILQVVRETEGVLPEPKADVLVIGLAESSVMVRARWWIKPPVIAETFDSIDRVIVGVKKALTENGIDLPFPTHQVLFHDQTEETDGNRARQREGWPAAGGKPPRAMNVPRVLSRLAENNEQEPEGAERSNGKREETGG